MNSQLNRLGRDASSPGAAATVPGVRHMSARATLRAPSHAATDSFAAANGTRISLRQIGPEDRAGLTDLFAHLSPESRYQRFLSPKRELSPLDLTYFTDIDHLNHEAIAAVDQRDDSMVGVARYVRYPGGADVAELGIEVADAFQRMGIGTALTSLAIQDARANGLISLTATTLWENHAARRLLRRHAFRPRRSHSGVIEHELKLAELEPACVDEPAREAGGAVGIGGAGRAVLGGRAASSQQPLRWVQD